MFSPEQQQRITSLATRREVLCQLAEAADPAHGSALRQLYAKLLAISGDTIAVIPDYDAKRILEEGKTCKGKILLKEGVASSCHGNVSLLTLTGDITKIFTGYALSRARDDDDLSCWRQHSWGKKGSHIIETTMARDIYYGRELHPDEEMNFIMSNIDSAFDISDLAALFKIMSKKRAKQFMAWMQDRFPT